MTIREAIDLIVSRGRSLSEDEAAAVTRDIMSGEAPFAKARTERKQTQQETLP